MKSVSKTDGKYDVLSSIKRISGTPWHVGYVGLQEGESRRHRARCVNYDAGRNGYCHYYSGECRGSAHCSHYVEKANREANASKQGKVADNVCTGNITVIAFKGIKQLRISSIVVDEKGFEGMPSEKKVAEVIAYYNAHGALDKPIVVRIENDQFHLQDGFVRLFAAHKLGLVDVPCEMGTEAEIMERNAVRTIGNLVWDTRKSDVAEVIDSSLSRVTVRYDDGRERTFDIHTALAQKTIKLLYAEG